MSRAICFWVLGAGMVLSEMVMAAGGHNNDVYFDVSSITYSESMPVYSYFKDWKSDQPIKGGNAYTHTEASVNVRHRAWTAGVGRRYDYAMEVTPDFARVYANVKQDNAFDPGTYQLGAYANHFSADFIRASYLFQPAPTVDLFVQLNALKLGQLTRGNLGADITAVGAPSRRPDISAGTAYVDYVYDDPKLKEDDAFNWYPDAPSGKGVTADLGLDWRLHDRWQVSVYSYDLLNYLKWKDVPATRYAGYYVKSPFDYNLQGKLDVLDTYRQTISPRTITRLDYRTAPVVFSLDNTHVSHLNMTRFSVDSGAMLKNWSVGTGYWFQPRALDLHLGYKDYVTLNVGLNNANYKNSSFLNLGLRFNYPF